MRRIISFILSFIFLASSAYANKDVEALKQRVCNVLPHLEGWCSKEKALNFIDLILTVKPDVCVEIGVFGGGSVFPVASALKFLEHGTIIAIDPWDRAECMKYLDPVKDKAHIEWWSKVNLTYIYYSYLNMLRRYEIEEYTTTLKLSSEKAAPEVGEIDILYIDGNHTETAILRDVELYLPKVREGGYVWLNDTLWETTQPAVEILLESCDVVKLIDSGNCILFKKR